MTALCLCDIKMPTFINILLMCAGYACGYLRQEKQSNFQEAEKDVPSINTVCIEGTLVKSVRLVYLT